jgi:hypothetical protein
MDDEATFVGHSRKGDEAHAHCIKIPPPFGDIRHNVQTGIAY